MADELQALLDKITDDELKKADAEKEKILTQARDEAAEIVKTAKAEAATMISNAQKEAAMFEQKGNEALRQASRDVLLSLRSELEKRVTTATEALMRETLSGSSLADIVVKLIENFLSSNGSSDDIQVLLAPGEVATVESAVKAKLAQELQEHAKLAPSPSVNGGFKLIFKEAGVVYDFSDKALAETVAAGLSSKIAAVISE